MQWTVFPPNEHYPYKPGDTVSVKSKNTKLRYWKGIVVSVDEKGIQVQPAQKQDSHDGPITTIRNYNKLTPLINRDEPTIIITEESSFFRQQSCQVDGHDSVLEIGCCNGETSKLLIPRAKQWTGFDTSDGFINECRQYMKNFSHTTHTRIAKVDALVHPGHAFDEATKLGAPPNVVFIDIGGNRECYNVLRMLSWCRSAFVDNLELVVIKSRELVQALRSSNVETDPFTGHILNGDEWQRQYKVRRVMPKHPLRAPKVMTPDGSREICRYRNYHNEGCTLPNCPLDHEYCPACFGRDHIARDCSVFTNNYG
jgi:SAM-dependent methyltransferase